MRRLRGSAGLWASDSCALEVHAMRLLAVDTRAWAGSPFATAGYPGARLDWGGCACGAIAEERGVNAFLAHSTTRPSVVRALGHNSGRI